MPSQVLFFDGQRELTDYESTSPKLEGKTGGKSYLSTAFRFMRFIKFLD